MSGEQNTATADTPQVLLEHHLKQLRLPTFLREYDKVARQCAAESVDYPRYLLRLTEQELLDRERRACERRIHQARCPVVKSLDASLLWGWDAPTRYIGIFESTRITGAGPIRIPFRFRPAWCRYRLRDIRVVRRRGLCRVSWRRFREVHDDGPGPGPGGPIPRATCYGSAPSFEFRGSRGPGGLLAAS
jgi:hypothetical protein